MSELNPTMLFLFSFPEAMVLAWLSLILIGNRPNLRQILQMGCIQTIFNAFLFLIVAKIVHLPFGVHTPAQLVVFALIIQRVMGLSLNSGFLSALMGFTLYISMENIMMAGITAIVGHSYFKEIDQTNWMMKLPYHYIQLVFDLALSFLIQRYSVWVIDSWPVRHKTNFLKLNGLLFAQTLMTSHMCCQYYSVMHDYLKDNFRFYFVLGNIVLPVITIIIVKKIVALMSGEVEIKARLDSFCHVEELLQTMRIQRHNFTHEMQVIYGLLEIQEYQEAREYLKKSMSEVKVTVELVKIDNPGIAALLYTKTGLAEARKIDLKITIETSLRQLMQQSRDISLILGNLIDNALDAVNDLPVGKRKVEVSVSQQLAGYILLVKNCGPPIPDNLSNEIFAPGVSSKGTGRGLGLYSVRKLVQKYYGDIQVTSNTNGTCFQVIIPPPDNARNLL